MYMSDERLSGVPADQLAVHVRLGVVELDRKLAALRTMATQTSGVLATVDLRDLRRAGCRGVVHRRRPSWRLVALQDEPPTRNALR